MRIYKDICTALLAAMPLWGVAAVADKDSTANVVDEVVWVVGDEAILKSDIEVMRLQAAMEGMRWERDPDCAIPEQIAVQKLFLHQAAIDSIDVTESEIASQIDRRIDYMISQTGSREKLEEYRKQTINQIRSSMHDDLRDQLMIQKMKEKIVKDIVVTPAEVRRFFKDVPQDSIPFVPTEVEVQIIVQTPKVAPEEINRVKDRLREFTERVQSGETTFQTLARFYSEDGTARNGGELGYTGRAVLDPAFASVAFNLTDPKKISKIVESEFGFHIIQLIDKRGEKINVRHILLKPVVADSAIEQSIARLDSIAADIRDGKFTFEEAATYISDDKKTRSNRGLMATDMNRTGRNTSKFRMDELPPEVARVVDTLQVGQMSRPFTMVNEQGKTVCMIAKLKSRMEGHKANVGTDFQVMKDVVIEKRRDKALHDWVVKKIKNTYVRIGEKFRNCDFEYEGWIR